MKKITLVTPVPDLIKQVIQDSMLRQAVNNEIVDFNVINLRDHAEGNYRQIDDIPFGGGSGMVMMPEPIIRAIESVKQDLDPEKEIKIIYPSPQGKKWSHETALEMSECDQFVFICGHYKGIDERIIEKYGPEEYSIGDFVTTSGELPAMLMIDSMVRLIPGVLNNYDSALSDSFATGLLDAPYYTRPREVEGMAVPDVLLSGHHKQIDEWRQTKREERTKERRPDIWKKFLENRDETE